MPTITQIVTQIAPISEVLASNDISKGALFGAPLNTMWAIQIYTETQSCLFRYTQEGIASGNTPSATMIANSNYLYSIICGKYGQMALALYNAGGQIPGTGGGGVIYGYPISSSYTAAADGETVLTLRTITGALLPNGSLVVYVVKGIQFLSSDNYSYSEPNLTLLNGIQTTQDEVIGFMYVVPV